MRYFVMEEEGLFGQLLIPVSGKRLPDGPNIVQASVTDDSDVMMFGIILTVIVMDKDIPAKIIVTNIKNAVQILATGELAALWEEHGSDASVEFEAEEGRKFTFDISPPGSIPDALLRYWTQSTLGFGPEEDVNIKGLGNAAAVQQALLSNNADGTSVMEPAPAVIDANDTPLQSIA